MNKKPATLETINRRFMRAIRAAGGPTIREARRQQRRQDGENKKTGEAAAEEARRLGLAA
jgi:protein involved in polysaccharide export with SLBB domain